MPRPRRLLGPLAPPPDKPPIDPDDDRFWSASTEKQAEEARQRQAAEARASKSTIQRYAEWLREQQHQLVGVRERQSRASDAALLRGLGLAGAPPGEPNRNGDAYGSDLLRASQTPPRPSSAQESLRIIEEFLANVGPQPAEQVAAVQPTPPAARTEYIETVQQLAQAHAISHETALNTILDQLGITPAELAQAVTEIQGGPVVPADLPPPEPLVQSIHLPSGTMIMPDGEQVLFAHGWLRTTQPYQRVFDRGQPHYIAGRPESRGHLENLNLSRAQLDLVYGARLNTPRTVELRGSDPRFAYRLHGAVIAQARGIRPHAALPDVLLVESIDFVFDRLETLAATDAAPQRTEARYEYPAR